MAALRLKLLGGLEAFDTTSSQTVAFPRKKAAALLAYLATPAGNQRSREEIAGLLWGYTDDAGARNSLRQTLLVIRRALPNFAGLEATPQSIALLSQHASIDVAEFELAAVEGTPAALERAARLYAGEFLQGFSVPENPFENWKAQEAARLRDIGLSVFEGLMTHYLGLDRHADAIRIAGRALTLDPLHEVVHRTLMKAYAAQGRMGLAARQYEDFRNALATELGVKPDAETESVYSSLANKRRGSAIAGNETIGISTTVPDGSKRPVLAVLPFDTSETDSLPLAGSLTPKLIAVLARALPLTVVDQHSVTVASTKTTQTTDLARLFGARYVVEGSIGRVDGHWIVNFSVIDVPRLRHIGSGGCDIEDDGPFRSAERVANRIVARIAFQIEVAERRRAAIERLGPLGAWEKFHRGMALMDLHTPDGIPLAQQCFSDAMAMEPGNARNIAGLSQAILQEGVCHAGKGRADKYALSLELALQAYALDSRDPYVDWTLGKSYLRLGWYSLAFDSLQKALDAIPDHPEVRATIGNLMAFSGKPEKSLLLLHRSLKSTDTVIVNIARSHLQMGDYQRAYHWSKRTLQLQPFNTWAHILLGSALGHLDRQDEAEATLMECEKISPGRVGAEFLTQPPQYESAPEHLAVVDGLQKAGWRP